MARPVAMPPLRTDRNIDPVEHLAEEHQERQRPRNLATGFYTLCDDEVPQPASTAARASSDEPDLPRRQRAAVMDAADEPWVRCRVKELNHPRANSPPLPLLSGRGTASRS